MEIKKANLKFGLLYERALTNKVIIHHSASDTDNINTIHNYHKDVKKWSGCGYHFVIHQNGDIFEGRGINVKGAHALGQNDDSLGICVCGDLDKSHMTQQQKDSLKWLLSYLLDIYPRTQIYQHKNYNNTTCPGNNFDTDIIISALAGTEKIKEHWAEKIYEELTEHFGLTIHEKRFDDKITRAESMAMSLQVLKAVGKMYKLWSDSFN